MSHVTTVKLKVRDLEALAEAAAQCGLELREKSTYAWWGVFAGDTTPPPGRDPARYGKDCVAALGRPGTTPRNGGGGEWEVGVVPALDGDGYDLMLDEFGTPGRTLMAGCGGAGLPKLKQEYGVAVATREAKRKLGPKGFTVHRENLSTGVVRLRLRKR